jgi:hypothetical protein
LNRLDTDQLLALHSIGRTAIGLIVRGMMDPKNETTG